MCIHKHPYNMLIKAPEKIQGVKLKTHLGIVFKRKSHDPVSNKHSHREVCLFFLVQLCRDLEATAAMCHVVQPHHYWQQSLEPSTR